MDTVVIIIPIKHVNLDTHLHQKEKITQTNHHLKKEPLLHCPLRVTLQGPIDPLMVTVQMSTLPMDPLLMDPTLMDLPLMDTIHT
ncbi:hypothetical protein NL503_26780, partial [Klebsiella pneumoniae]|nr:hypothetical protein [Klebsiella pneumoniae]